MNKWTLSYKTSKGMKSQNSSFNPFPNKPWFMCLQCKTFENTVGKGEIARNEQISPFPTLFSTCLKNFLPFSSDLKLSSANSFSLEESKILSFGKGLTLYHTNPSLKDPKEESSLKSLWENQTHAFSLFPAMFSNYQWKNHYFSRNYSVIHICF